MTAQEAQWLKKIIAKEELHVLFQPIVNASQQAVYGYEALIRGPRTSPLHSPLRLFEVATQAGKLVELDILCRRLAIYRFAELKLPGLLFLNVMPLTIVERDFREGLTLGFIRDSGLPPARVVIELTEHVPIHDYELMRQAVDHYRTMGFQVALYAKRRVSDEQGVAAAYVDLDNFKAFNDAYGYARGDHIIISLSRLLQAQVDNVGGFIGHIGGDDFMMLLPLDHWESVCGQILRSFEVMAPGFYEDADRLRGGIQIENRQNSITFSPLLACRLR